MHPIGVDACPAMIPWNVSCTGVRYDNLSHISMKVSHHEILRDPTVNQYLGHLVPPDRDLNDEQQVLKVP
jgi:hypothetical protein